MTSTNRRRLLCMAVAMLSPVAAWALATAPIKMGISSAMRYQSGRDTRDGAQLTIDEIIQKLVNALHAWGSRNAAF